MRLTAFGLIVVLLAGIFSGCTPAAQQPAQPGGEDGVVTISFWHGWAVEHEKEAVEGAVKLFNESHPNIKVEPVAGKTNDQVLTAVSGGSSPDVYSLWSTQTLAEWASKGVITDLNNKALETKLDPGLFYQGALEVSMYEGRYFGLPVEVDPMVVYYNKGIFREAGLDPETPPATMEELYAIAEQLTLFDDNGNVTQLGFANGTAFMEAYMYGGEWWNSESGQPTANDPANIESWNVISAFHQKFSAEKINTFNSQQADNPLGSLFLAGKVGMALDGDWVVNFLTRFAPDLDFGMFPLPPAAGHDDRAYSTYIDGAIYVIPTNAPHPEEAWEFIHWMATTPEASGMIQKGLSNTSPLKAVVKDSQYAPHDRWALFTEMMDHGNHFVWPPIAVSSMYYTEMNTALDAVKYGEKEPMQALEELQNKIKQELEAASQ